MITQDDLQRRLVRTWVRDRPLWVLDCLIETIAADPKWQPEVQPLAEIRTRVDLRYRRDRPSRTAAAEWLIWIRTQHDA